MLLNEILNESVTYSVSKFNEKEGYHDLMAFSSEEYVECFVCNGRGVEVYYDKENDKYYYPEDIDGFGDVSKFKKIECSYCEGSGKTHEMVSNAPELNVANRNSDVILDMLGIERDYAGTIPNKQLPDIRRKLIKIKNKGVGDYQIDQSETKSKIKDKKVIDDNGVPTIMTVRSPRMFDMGLSEERISQYIDQLLKIIEFAQKNDADVGWG